MNITKKRTDNGNVVTFCLPEKFNFELHAEFRELYESEKKSKNMILDMDKTQYMDSSALGMMLQIKEFADSCKSTVSVKNANKNVLQILQLAHFDKLFLLV